MRNSVLFSGVILLSFYITVLLGVNKCGCRFRSDYEYFDSIDGYMKYQEIPANFHEANLRCRLEGSTLASPLSEPLKYRMLQLSQNTSPTFTGIHSTFSKGDFFSVEGVPLAQINHTWTRGEADFNVDEECIAMFADGTFINVKCSATFPYICYKKVTPGMFMTECGSPDASYTLDSRTGSCYKFHQFPRTWSRAYMTCAAEGGYLAIINNEVEARALSELYEKMGVVIPSAGTYFTNAYIGFLDWGQLGEWLTIHGDTLKDAGYDKFASGQPNNISGQFCGAMLRSGLLEDTWCDEKAQFICEKKPNSLTCDHE